MTEAQVEAIHAALLKEGHPVRREAIGAALAAARSVEPSETAAYKRGFDQGGAVAADAWFAAGIEAAAKTARETGRNYANNYRGDRCVGAHNATSEIDRAIRALRPPESAESEREVMQHSAANRQHQAASSLDKTSPLPARKLTGAPMLIERLRLRADVARQDSRFGDADDMSEAAFKLDELAGAPSEEDLARLIRAGCNASDEEVADIARAIMALLQRGAKE